MAKSIEDLEAVAITGKDDIDSELRNDVHCFIHDSANSMEEKIRAMAIMDALMGFDPGEIHVHDVVSYIMTGC